MSNFRPGAWDTIKTVRDNMYLVIYDGANETNYKITVNDLFGEELSSTIYNGDGTLTGNRDVYLDGYNLYFKDSTASDNTLVQLTADGQLTFSAYGSGGQTGSLAYFLAVDASGNLIEVAESALAGDTWSDACDSDIVPDTDATYNIGSSSEQFKELYITSLNISNTTPITSILDEDDMTSDSDTALATQQSIKAYVDTQIASLDTDVVANQSNQPITLSISSTSSSAQYFNNKATQNTSGTSADTMIAIVGDGGIDMTGMSITTTQDSYGTVSADYLVLFINGTASAYGLLSWTNNGDLQTASITSSNGTTTVSDGDYIEFKIAGGTDGTGNVTHHPEQMVLSIAKLGS